MPNREMTIYYRDNGDVFYLSVRLNVRHLSHKHTQQPTQGEVIMEITLIFISMFENLHGHNYMVLKGAFIKKPEIKAEKKSS